MGQIKFSGTVGAFVSNAYAARAFAEAMKAEDHQKAFYWLQFSSVNMDEGSDPWMRIGTAEVTVTLPPNFDIRSERVKALEAALQKDRAESHARQTALLGEINKLKAIEHCTGEVAA